MTTADFPLSAVPLRGPLAPIAALLSDGDTVITDNFASGAWRGPITARPDRPVEQGWVWLDCLAWVWVPISRLNSVDLVTSPAARSAVVAWLEEQGYTAAHTGDEALLIVLRHVCGLPPAPRSVDDCDDDATPF